MRGTPLVISMIVKGLESAHEAGVAPKEILVGPDEELAITRIANEWPSLGGRIQTFVGMKFGGLMVSRMTAPGVAIR